MHFTMRRHFIVFNPLFIDMGNRLMMKRAVYFSTSYFKYNKRKRREEYKRHVARNIYILMQSFGRKKKIVAINFTCVTIYTNEYKFK